MGRLVTVNNIIIIIKINTIYYIYIGTLHGYINLNNGFTFKVSTFVLCTFEF